MEFRMDVVSKLLDLYPAQAALIDGNRNILAVNRSWADFAALDVTRDLTQGSEFYLAAFNLGAVAGDASTVDSGILSVLSGALESFGYMYEFGSPARRWFHLNAAPFRPSEDQRWAILLHTEVTNKHVETGEIVTFCGWCKRLPDGENWIDFEEYFSKWQGIRFSHGMCPECRDTVLQEVPVSSGAHSGV
jgi:hypothetical protein